MREGRISGTLERGQANESALLSLALPQGGDSQAAGPAQEAA